MNSMDGDTRLGIGAWISSLDSCLQRTDEPLWQDLHNKNIETSFFAFRWLSVLLAREFSLPDLIRLWDSIFSDRRRYRFLVHISCAMIMAVRETLLKDTYQLNIQLLQEYPEMELNGILQKAYEIYDEEMLTVALHKQLSRPSSPNMNATATSTTTASSINASITTSVYNFMRQTSAFIMKRSS